MEKNNKENNIFEILAAFEDELKQKLEEQKSEIERVKYYEKLTIQGIDLENAFVVEEKDVDGNISYNVYAGDSSAKIMTFGGDGKIEQINPELEKFTGKDFDLKAILEINEKETGKLIGSSEKAKSKEIEEKLQEKDEKNPEKQIEKDIADEKGEDLQIINYREIKDNNLNKQMKGKFKGAEEKGIGYSKKLGAFVMLQKNDGKFEMSEGFEPAKPTMKSVISISEDGKEIERKVPHALMKTDDPTKEMSITIGQYGYIEAGTIDRLPCNERIEMQLREDGEGQKGQNTKQVQDIKDKGGKEEVHEIAHAFNDTEEIIKQEADKAKVSVDEFKRYLKDAEGETLEEKIENVQEQVAEDYGAPNKTK